MSTKIRKRFEFNYDLKHKVVRNLKVVTESVGALQVEYVGYLDTSASILEVNDRYNIDISAVYWEGVNIMPVLEVVGGLDEIGEAAMKHFAALVNESIAA